MNNNPESELFSRMVAGLTDNDLEQLRSVLHWETDKRNNQKYSEGKFPALNSAEMALVNNGLRINAIKEYQNRTNQSLITSKLVVENYHDELINAGHRKQNP